MLLLAFTCATAALGSTEARRELEYDALGLDAYSRDQSNKLLQYMKDEGLEEMAKNNSCGFWIAVRTANASIVASVGYSSAAQPLEYTRMVAEINQDHDPHQHQHQHQQRREQKNIAARSTDVIPNGSLMKSFTAAAIMRLVDVGAIDLDDSVTQHVDPYLKRIPNSTSLEDAFGPNIVRLVYI